MGFELAHEAAAQLLLDLEVEQPAGTGPRRPESDLAATYETVSERWTEDGICVACLRSEPGGFSWSWRKEGSRPRAGYATEHEALADARLRCPYCGGEQADYPRRDGSTAYNGCWKCDDDSYEG